MSGCMVWWVSGWVGSDQITQNQINLDPIKIIQFWTFFWAFLLKPLKPQGYFWQLTYYAYLPILIIFWYLVFDILLKPPEPFTGLICGDTPTYVWLGGLMGGSCQTTKNWINFDLIEILQFCLKIYDLLVVSCQSLNIK